MAIFNCSGEGFVEDYMGLGETVSFWPFRCAWSVLSVIVTLYTSIVALNRFIIFLLWFNEQLYNNKKNISVTEPCFSVYVCSMGLPPSGHSWYSTLTS